MSCSWASNWLFAKLCELLFFLSFVLKTACECSSRSKRHYHSQRLLWKQSCFGWCNLDQLLSTRASNFTYGSSSNPDDQFRLKTRLPLLLGQGGSAAPWVFQRYPTQSELFIPFPQRIYYLKNLY